MSQNLKIISWNNGPKIKIHIEMESGKVRSSRLELSDRFTCICSDPFFINWIEDYLQKKTSPISIHVGDSFQTKVMKALNEIPFGKTESYRDVAVRCSIPKGARAIGNACKKNPFPLLVPCHRVIRSDGSLGGFAYNLEIKRRLLEFELGTV